MNTELRFWVRPTNGVPHEVDLTEFAEGGSIERVVAKARASWAGDFAGRPGLAAELRRLFTSLQPNEKSTAGWKNDFRTLFRFLDSIDPDLVLEESTSLTDLHGVALYDWVPAKSRIYGRIKTHLDRLRALAGAYPLAWPARPRDMLGQVGDIEPASIKRLYTAMKREGMDIKAMFREGSALASGGSDPRGEVSYRGSAAWHERRNHAWLVHQLTSVRLLDKAEFAENRAQGLNKANDARQKHDGPAYLAPLMTERGREGFVGKLRWFHPSYHDTAIFLWLFLLGTGWNLSTALGLDVSAMGGWHEDHPQKPEFKILHAYKGRADKHQFVPSLAKPEWHPFGIVSYMIERTAPIRRTAQHRLDLLRPMLEREDSPQIERDIRRLEKIVSSPWIYHVVNKVGEVGTFADQDSARLNDIAREVVRRHDLELEHPDLPNITTSQARDAWIGHAYASSGHNVLLTRLAAQHSDARTLRHYLGRRRYRSQSEKAVRRVQDAAFSEIERGRVLDPTKLRIMVQNGRITPEQEARLLDGRQRTKQGMGCLDPTIPPRSIAPDHVEGSLCRVQRCTGCSHGLVFEDSLDSLAKSRAQLIHIKSRIPLSAWFGSSLEHEEKSIDATLTAFDTIKVEAAISAWLTKIDRGEVTVDDIYPSY